MKKFLHIAMMPVFCLLLNGSSRAAWVVTEDHVSAAVGAEILKAGGNAIDAAVATAFAQTVVYGKSAPLGGGGFMVIWLARRQEAVAIDFREQAPSGLKLADFKGSKGAFDSDKLLMSGLGTGIPGTVAGLEEALQRYGTKSREELLMPAIKLAEDGYYVTDVISGDIGRDKAKLLRAPGSRAIYFDAAGTPKRSGDLIVQRLLGQTLRAIASKGAPEFYRGELSAKIVAEINDDGGCVTKEDLAGYSAHVSPARFIDFHGVRIFLPGAPSGGPVLALALNSLSFLEADDKSLGRGPNGHYPRLIRALRLASDEAVLFNGDPYHGGDQPQERFFSPNYAATRIQEVDAIPAVGTSGWPEHAGNTSHVSVLDSEGNAVSITYSLGGNYGSGYTGSMTGITYNAEIGGFAFRPEEYQNARFNRPKGGRRMASSMAPVIGIKDGKAVVVIGCPGGERIISGLAQVMDLLLADGWPLQKAVDAPRIHVSFRSNIVEVEQAPLRAELQNQKWLQPIPEFAPAIFPVSLVQAITSRDGKTYAVSDKRGREGAAIYVPDKE